MNFLKKTILISILALATNAATAQLSVGASFSYLNFLGDYSELSTPGLSLRGDYAQDDRLVFTGGFGYYFGNTDETEYTLSPLSSTNNPITVEGENSYSFINVYVGAKRYFVGDYEGDFNIYGELDLGLLLSPYKSEITESYNESNYQTPELTDETFSNFIIGAGVGMEANLGFGYGFAEAKLNIPANQENGETVEVEIPGQIALNLGVRIPFE